MINWNCGSVTGVPAVAERIIGIISHLLIPGFSNSVVAYFKIILLPSAETEEENFD